MRRLAVVATAVAAAVALAVPASAWPPVCKSQLVYELTDRCL